MNGEVEAGTQLLRQIAGDKRERKTLRTCVLKALDSGDNAGLQGPPVRQLSSPDGQTVSMNVLGRFSLVPLETIPAFRYDYLWLYASAVRQDRSTGNQCRTSQASGWEDITKGQGKMNASNPSSRASAGVG